MEPATLTELSSHHVFRQEKAEGPHRFSRYSRENWERDPVP